MRTLQIAQLIFEQVPDRLSLQNSGSIFRRSRHRITAMSIVIKNMENNLEHSII